MSLQRVPDAGIPLHVVTWGGTASKMLVAWLYPAKITLDGSAHQREVAASRNKDPRLCPLYEQIRTDYAAALGSYAAEQRWRRYPFLASAPNPNQASK